MIGKSNIRERILSGEKVISCMLRFPDPASVEIMALAGVDLLIVDNEHYPFNEEKLIDLIRAADVHGMAVVVRVPDAEPTRIAKIMDCGADGIRVPSVDSYEEAMQLVHAVKYAPEGERGYCPITRANDYGFGMDAKEFAAYSNRHSLVCVQIESKEGIEDLDRIFSIPEVDIVDYGASDMSASYGIPGHNDDPVVVSAVNTFLEKAKAAGKQVARMAYTPEEVKKYLDEGYRIITLASDQQIVYQRCASMIQAIPGKEG